MNEKSFKVICCYDKDTDNLKIDIMEVKEDGIELYCTFNGVEAKSIYEELVRQNLVERFNNEKV